MKKTSEELDRQSILLFSGVKHMVCWQDSMFDVSVVICAHNPRPDYLGRVLESVRAQTHPVAQWELLLVDNASSSPLASTWDISWHPNGRHLVEKELGLSLARQHAIRRASSDLILFVDDDNIVDPNFIAESVKIKCEWPVLGVWGSGAIIPEFEVLPIDRVKPLLPYLALREVASPQWANFPGTSATPWGAGLCVRSNVAAAYLQLCAERSIQITGRRGRDLLSGEDVEICHVCCKTGLGIGIFPELRITHLIPKERVTEEYLIKIFEGTQISNLLLSYKWNGWFPWPPLTGLGVLSIFKNVITQRGIHRQIYLANVRAAEKARRIIVASSGK
jgi:glycosyltransferase involved in cell wall biosynthesis